MSLDPSSNSSPRSKKDPGSRGHPADQEKRTTRRRFVAATSLLALGTGASAAWHYLPSKRPDLRKLEEALLRPRRLEVKPPKKDPSQKRPHARIHRPSLPGESDYRSFLASLDLRYISANEVISPHIRERRGISNKLPPRELWTRMAPTLHIADELRHRLGVKMRYITSAYRSPAYNAACSGSATRSQHIQNRALDLVYDCSPHSAMTEALKMRDEGLFKGGIGLYSSFIHIDTRGRNATW